MATRAILRRKKYLFDSLNRSKYLIQGSSGFQHESSSAIPGDWSRAFSYSSLNSDHGKGEESKSLTRDEFINLTVRRPHFVGTYTFDPRKGGQGSLLGVRGVTEYVRYYSTAAAGQPDPGRHDEPSLKKKKEASPEECDQAVEGLSSVKAKAKAKKLQDTQKDSKPMMQRIWAMFLGIGPALKAVASMSREDWAKKLLHWKDEFKSTMQHYWLGTKLLWADVRISAKLLHKLANGKGLSRRERQQLTRTTADIFRLVPVAVFIVVPFMEFLLPVFLKLFPNMLPSTFQDKMKEQEALKRKLNARIEYAKFLQETVKEMAGEVKDSRSGEIMRTAEDLDEFMDKVRKGTAVSNDEILGFAKLFNDELTLDNISRPRLVNMCKYMNIQPFGTDAYLRHMLRMKLRKIKEDDKMIQVEGVESLSEDELRQACRDRGMLGLVSVDEMRQQLKDWLDLSLNHSVPSSLLILSRAFTVAGKVRLEDAVQATLSSLPDEVVDTIQVTSLPSEDAVSERRRKLEYLEMQEELMEEEEEKEEAAQARLKDKQKDVALEEMTTSTEKEAQRTKENIFDKHEQLCETSKALAVLASASSVSREREEFLRLVNKEIELYNSMVEKEGTEEEAAAKKAYKAARVDSDQAVEKALGGDQASSALRDRVDGMLQKLEKEIDDVDATIGDRWRLLDRDSDGKVTPEEVASAAIYLKDTLGKEGIDELIRKLSKDKEGKILVEDIVKLGNEMEEETEINEDRETKQSHSDNK